MTGERGIDSSRKEMAAREVIDGNSLDSGTVCSCAETEKKIIKKGPLTIIREER